MKKSLVVILAVAIIGVLGVYTKSHKGSASSGLQSASTTTSSNNTASTVGSSTPNSSGSSSSASTSSTGAYKDGTYSGDTVSTEYGDIQVAAVISGGKIVDVKFLQMPNDRGHTQEVTYVASPLLKQSTLSNQNAQVDFVSGATTTSQAYEQSIQAALNQAV